MRGRCEEARNALMIFILYQENYQQKKNCFNPILRRQLSLMNRNWDCPLTQLRY